MAGVPVRRLQKHTISTTDLSIAAVERDTGLSKDTLRVWERRYGFPAPLRDALGERSYPVEQLARLRLIKRLLDAGHRPGRIVPLPSDQLQALAGDGEPDAAVPSGAELQSLLALIREPDAAALRAELARLLGRAGLMSFVTGVIAPLNGVVGEAWLRGQLEVWQEHVYTEAIQSVLRQAVLAMPVPPASARPRVLLSTVPGEPHGLGLLMAEAVFTNEGSCCLSLGVSTPLWDIVLAASAHRADIVALSFTGFLTPAQVGEGLAELRAKLPPAVQVWAGGSAPALQRRSVPGVTALASLDALPAALQRWRDAATGARG